MLKLLERLSSWRKSSNKSDYLYSQCRVAESIFEIHRQVLKTVTTNYINVIVTDLIMATVLNQAQLFLHKEEN